MELAISLDVDAENPNPGDLRLKHGNLVWTTDLGEEVAQRLIVRFNFWKTEWFANLDAGTPWLQAIFDKAVPDRVVRAVLSAVIATTEGVAAIDSLTFTTTDRVLDVQFTARLQDGTAFRSTEYGPFVVRF